jgi:sortase (surface protein transpeptidase)
MALFSTFVMFAGIVLLLLGQQEQNDDSATEISSQSSEPLELAQAPDFRPEAQHDSLLGTCVPLPPLEGPAAALPVLLSIPTLDVVAQVLPTNVSNAGVVEVPADVSTVGWVVTSSTPGDPRGAAMVVGHRDGAGGLDGALYDLGQLSRGDVVTVLNADGITLEYVVVAREILSRSQFASQAESYSSTGGDPRLTIVTCGGEYIKSSGGYQSNVVITAVPSSP